MKINFLTFAIVTLGLWSSSQLFAVEASIVTQAQSPNQVEELNAPIPADNSDLAVQPLSTDNVAIQNSPMKVNATKFSVVGLFRCGEKVRATGLIGRWNSRPRACTEEAILAEVFTTAYTCDNCQTRSAARGIRIDRRFGSACECPEYIHALAQDLSSSSLRMRIAATRSLRVCGFRVEESTVCVEQPVPFVVMYL